MILKYQFQNYRSFSAQTELSFVASSQRTLNDNLIRVDGKRILPSAVIYGANASGKSNIISSIELFREIVLRGTISASDNRLLANLQIIPFIYDSEEHPVSFSICFISNGKQIQYDLTIYVGSVEYHSRKILRESLTVWHGNKKFILFERDGNAVDLNMEKAALKEMGVDQKYIREVLARINQNVDDISLFLTGGFKSAISVELANTVYEFFDKHLFVISSFDDMLEKGTISVKMPQKYANTKEFVFWNRVLDAFFKGADFGEQHLVFEAKSEGEQSSSAKLISIYPHNGKQYGIPAELMESQGTLKLIKFVLLLQIGIANGATFIIDEFDSSLHPEIVRGILELFHDPSFNKHGAQLIFSTHNPIYLDNQLFRRDQIMFVERDRTSYQSVLYTLADFGSIDVRNDENYLINYFRGKYSSMPYIDFRTIFKDNSEG